MLLVFVFDLHNNLKFLNCCLFLLLNKQNGDVLLLKNQYCTDFVRQDNTHCTQKNLRQLFHNVDVVSISQSLRNRTRLYSCG